MTFQYQAYDGTDLSNVSTVSITIGGVTDGPINSGLDVLAANYGWQNTLYLNNGSVPVASFTGSYLPGGSINSYSIALGDIDGDHDLDAVVVNPNQASQLLINDPSASGGFTVQTPFIGVTGAISVALGDIDGDHNLDAVFSNYNGSIQLLLNNGSGGFAAPTNLQSGTVGSYDVALGDVNKDGLPDIVVQDISGGPNQLLIESGKRRFYRVRPSRRESFRVSGRPWRFQWRPIS